MDISKITNQEFVAIWEFAEYLETTEKGSELYNDIKELLLEKMKYDFMKGGYK